MFIVIVVMAGIILFAALSVAILPLFEIYHINNSQVIAGDIAAIQQAVNYEGIDNIGALYTDGYAYPSDVAGSRINVNLPEYRHLVFLNHQRYKHIETTLNYESAPARTVRSHRMAIWFESPFGNFLENDYTKAAFNRCGTGDISTAKTWCGDSKSIWAKLETHTGHYELIQSEQHRLYRLSRKFYRFYEETGSFEVFGIHTDAISNLVVGGPVVLGSCSGTYFYKNIPFDCQDMFNAWGKPIYFHSLSSEHVALTNSLGIAVVQPAGAGIKYVGIAEEINIANISQ